MLLSYSSTCRLSSIPKAEPGSRLLCTLTGRFSLSYRIQKPPSRPGIWRGNSSVHVTERQLRNTTLKERW